MCVVLLILSSQGLPTATRAPANPRVASAPALPPGNLSTSFPYVVDTSQFPRPDRLFNDSGGATSPALAVSDFAYSAFDLAYAQTDWFGWNSLRMVQGSYSPAVANSIFNNTTACSVTCPPRLPLLWGAPQVIHNFSSTPITAVALATKGYAVAIAATAANKTYVYVNVGAGQQGWKPLTGANPITGNTPRLAVSPCGSWYGQPVLAVLLTTLWQGTMTATTFLSYCVPTYSSSGGGNRPIMNSPGPTVTSVSPSSGYQGLQVTITGTGFASGATVAFGTTPAGGVTYVSSTTLYAVVPQGSGTVDVRVTVNGVTSPISAGDKFTYSTPTVTSVTPNSGPPNTAVTITGTNFTSAALVSFGGIVGVSVHYVSPTVLTAVSPTPPPYTGPVNVTVSIQGVTSAITSADVYTYSLPAPVSVSFPNIVGASPLWLPGSVVGVEGILGANSATGKVLFYNSTNLGNSFSSVNVGSFNATLGSSIFDRVGSTRIVTPGGTPGQVAAAAENTSVFGVVSTQSLNAVVAETFSSTNGGTTWGTPFLTQATSGSLSDPQLSISPAGYFYLTWRETGAGPWRVDQSIFTEGGRLIYGPEFIPNSGGGKNQSAQAPTVAVDGFQRPLYAWGWPNGTGGNEIRTSGGFLRASQVESYLQTQLNATSRNDFAPNASFSLSRFLSNMSSDFNALRADMNRNLTCPSLQVLVRQVYPNITNGVPPPLHTGPGGCTLNPRGSFHYLANLSGPLVAATSLLVYAEWLGEAIGWGQATEPFWGGSPNAAPLPLNPLPPALTGSYRFDFTNQTTDSTGFSDVFRVAPVTETPNTILFQTYLRFASESQVSNSAQAGYSCVSSTYWADGPSSYSITLTLNDSNNHSYSNSFGNVSPYVRAIPSGDHGYWSATVSVTYQEWKTFKTNCPGKQNSYQQVPIKSGWPTNTTLPTIWGRWVTKDEYSWNASVLRNLSAIIGPAYSFHNSTNGSTYQAQDYRLGWNTSVLSTEYAALNSSAIGVYWHRNNTAPSYLSGYSLLWTAFPVRNSASKTVSARMTTAGGAPFGHLGTPTNASWSGGYPWANLQVLTWSCTFTSTANPVQIYGAVSSNITASTATLTWLSNKFGLGWVNYYELNGANFTATALEFANTNSSTKGAFPYGYYVQLHGLHPWGIYSAGVGVSMQSTTSNCVIFQNWTTLHLQTQSLASFAEFEYPYDSVTQQGGGAVLEWQEPTEFVQESTFSSGTFSYWNSTTTVNVPLTSVWSVPDGGLFSGAIGSDTFGVNLTGLTPNSSYSVSLTANYSVRTAWGNYNFTAGSAPFTFLYLKDTTGDGLSDSEKVRGWPVTTQAANGTWGMTWATANPNLWATNGLVNDFVEKQFGLNPRTVDTAGSHVLDTWNLTFDLGGGSPSPPPGLNVRSWYEVGNFDWTTACQYYVTVGSCNKTVIAKGLSNLTDSSTWSARVLWTGHGANNALSKFVNMTGVGNASWLRGVLGASGGNRTITIWGKLSWGANPLAASTPLNGIADGNRVNPLTSVALQVGSLSASLTQCYHPPSGSYGWAMLFYLNWSTSSGPAEIANYSVQGSDTHTSCGSITGYQVPIPVNGTSQNQSLQVRMILNQSSSGSPNLKTQQFVSSTGTTLSVSYDMVQGKTIRFPATGTYSGTNGTLNFTLSEVAFATKAPTYLWLPTTNATLNNLPWGLKRYTGELAFDLVAVNASFAISSDAIPYAQNGSRTYSVSLSQGLNNLLVPRGQFLYSDFGQAVLLGKNVSYSNRTAPPLLGTEEMNLIGGYNMTNRLTNLSCYWQNRAINNTSGSQPPICPGGSGKLAESGTLLKAYGSLVSDVATAGNSINYGGDPGNPGLENSSAAGAALQGVFTLNVSSVAELDLLLAALLDNTTGGVNGTFLQVTFQVPQLGFRSAVEGGLRNVTLAGSGLFGIPRGTAPQRSCLNLVFFSICGILDNLPSGILLGLTLISMPWTLAAAAANYIDQHLPPWLRSAGASFITRSIAALASAASGLYSVFGAFVTWAIRQANASLAAALDFVFSPITAGIPKMSGTLNGLPPGQPATLAEALAFWQPIIPVFVGLGVVAAIVGVVLTVLTVFVGGAAALVTGLIVGLFLSAIVLALSIFDDSAITGFQTRLVWDADGFVNCTTTSKIGYACSPGSLVQQHDQGTWDAAAELAAAPQAGLIVSTVAFVLASWANAFIDLAGAVGFALSILGLAFTWYFLQHPGQPFAALVSVLLDSLSFFVDVVSLGNIAKSPVGSLKTANRMMDGVSLGSDSLSIALDLAKWGCTQSQIC